MPISWMAQGKVPVICNIEASAPRTGRIYIYRPPSSQI